MKPILILALLIGLIGCTKSPLGVIKSEKGIRDVIALEKLSEADFPLQRDYEEGLAALTAILNDPGKAEFHANISERIVGVKATEVELRETWRRFIIKCEPNFVVLHAKGALEGRSVEYYVIMNQLDEVARFWVKDPRQGTCFPSK